MSLLLCARFFKLIMAASLALGSAACFDSSKPAADSGTYFRMKVGLTYKGQPVDIDFVAGCGVHAGRDVSGGSIEEPVSMTAFVFGAKMPEGHAVVIRTVPINAGFQPCYGDTMSNGHIPKDWLPFIIWYEHDDDFAHGIGYSTQDAYENPNARFGFRSATVEVATKTEFDAFTRDGPNNLLPSYLTDWLARPSDPQLRSVDQVPDEMKQMPSKAWIYSGWPVCRGIQKIVLTPSQREQVRLLQPEIQKAYWAPLGQQAQFQAGFKIITEAQRDYKLHVYKTPYMDADRSKQPKIYPVDPGTSLARLTADTAKDRFYDFNVLYDGTTTNLGFVYCDAYAPDALETAVTGRVMTPAERTNNIKCRIEDFTIPIPGVICDGNWVVFYKDQFVIVPIQVQGS